MTRATILVAVLYVFGNRIVDKYHQYQLKKDKPVHIPGLINMGSYWIWED